MKTTLRAPSLDFFFFFHQKKKKKAEANKQAYRNVVVIHVLKLPKTNVSDENEKNGRKTKQSTSDKPQQLKVCCIAYTQKMMRTKERTEQHKQKKRNNCGSRYHLLFSLFICGTPSSSAQKSGLSGLENLRFFSCFTFFEKLFGALLRACF
jgi:hypothetical protein